MEILDAYLHCGLSKYEPIESVRATMKAAGVSRAVLVQHMGQFDNSYIGSVVASDPRHFAGVLLVDHHDPKAIDTLSRWVATGQFQGVRLTTEAVSEAPDLVAASANLGLVVVLYSPDGIRPYRAALEKALEAEPFLRLVITHLGNPAVTGTSVDESARDVLGLSRFANVYFQVSGMKMFCPYPHEPLFPLLADAFQRFGPNRLLWGSNYPVVGSQTDYFADLRLLLEGRLPVPKESIPRIVGENAQRLWFNDSP